MANTITLKGTFGTKQAFPVASTYNTTTGLYAPTATWYAGQLFVVSTAATSLVDDIVSVCSTSGSAVLGVALEDSADASTAVAGMAHPSGSKVTILHGHSKFEIQCGSTTKCYEQDPGILGDTEGASLMDLLYCSATGKFTPLKAPGTTPHPIGYITKVPSASNSYTLGVVLFG